MSFLLWLLACGEETNPTAKTAQIDPPVQAVPTVKPVDPPMPVQEPLTGEPRPGILVVQAWFWKNEKNKSKPGPARMDIWRQSADGWSRTRVEDADSNVFHKAIPWENGILTIGAEKAVLKFWNHSDGKWTATPLWTRSWGGKFDRLRDIEVGDVDGDGQDEWIVATHDAGVVAVIEPPAVADLGAALSPERITELDQKADTFVHEIELGDVDGDGKLEFFATPSDRNQSKKSQPGKIVMYSWDGTSYQRSIVDSLSKTHAKEILVANVDGDPEAEVFGVIEAERLGKVITQPVQIRQYTQTKEGFESKVVAELDDEQCRFLVPGDFDQDGVTELVAAGYKSGLWLLEPQADGTYSPSLIDADSNGYEHSTYGADLNGDGKLELYVAADKQRTLNQYTWNGKSFDKQKIGDVS